MQTEQAVKPSYRWKHTHKAGERPRGVWDDFIRRRISLSHTQKDVAGLFDVKQQTIAGWENRVYRPRRELRPQLAQYMGVDPDTLSRMIEDAFLPDREKTLS